MQSLLRDLGFQSEIFVEEIAPQSRDRCSSIRNIRIAPSDVLLIHHPIEPDALDVVAPLRCRKILVYHNITPPHLLQEGGSERASAVNAYAQLSRLPDIVEAAIAIFPNHARELAKRGFRDVSVIPLLRDFAALRQRPHSKTPYHDRSAVYRILFVGAVTPASSQHELIEFIEQTRAICRVPIELVLVGSFDADNTYKARLDHRIASARLGGQVRFTGQVDETELFGWYRAADAYLSLCEYQGPEGQLLEPMAFDLPVLAYAPPHSAAAETLGQAGLALAEKTGEGIVGALTRLHDDRQYRSAVLQAQRERVLQFSRRHVESDMRHWLAGLGVCDAAKDLPPPERCRSPASSAEGRTHYVVEGPYESSYSLAIVNRNLALALSRRPDAVVSIEPMEGTEDYVVDQTAAGRLPPQVRALVGLTPLTGNRTVTIRNTYPTRPNGMIGDLRLLHLAWEESAIPASVAELINFHTDGVLTPSQYAKSAIRNSGVRVPIAVIGHGIDHSGVPPRSRQRRRHGPVTQAMPFTFLHISSGLARKGIEELVTAYCLAFSRHDPVLLVIKTFDNPTNVVDEWVSRLAGEARNAPAIQVISEELEQQQLEFLYELADAMVLPTRGEGFNLPAAEALARGVPLIVTQHSGHLDFCNEENSRLVDYGPELSTSHLKVANSYWARASVDDLVEALTAARRDGRERDSPTARRAAKGQQDALALRWSHVADKLVGFAGYIERKPIMKRKLRLAWVSTYNARCGIAEHSAHLLEFFDPDAFEITIIADDQPPVGADRDNVVRLWKRFRGLAQIKEFIISEQFDAVMFQHHPAFYSFAELAEILSNLSEANILTFVGLHQTKDMERRSSSGLAIDIEAGFRSATRIFVHNVSDTNRLKDLNIVDNVVLLPLGVADRAVMDGPVVRSLLGLSRYDPVIGTFGFLLPHKGLLELIQAFALLLNRYPNGRLLMLNADFPDVKSQQERERCLALAATLRIDDKIQLVNDFLEFDEIVMMLSACHAIVFPYQETDESASAAVKLGLAAGRPVLTSPLAIFADISDAVFQLSGCDPIEIYEGIAHLLDHPDLQMEIVSRQRSWVKQNSWAAQAARLANIILGCFEESRQVVLQVPTHIYPSGTFGLEATSKPADIAVSENAAERKPDTAAMAASIISDTSESRQSSDLQPTSDRSARALARIFRGGFWDARRVPPERTAMARADRARDARDWQTATRCYREALLLVPDNAAAWVQYGHALKESGDAAAAEAAYRKSLELDPGVADTHLQLGHALKLRGRRIEAGVAYARALALDPALDHARTELKALGWSKGRIELALRSEHSRRA